MGEGGSGLAQRHGARGRRSGGVGVAGRIVVAPKQERGGEAGVGNRSEAESRVARPAQLPWRAAGARRRSGGGGGGIPRGATHRTRHRGVAGGSGGTGWLGGGGCRGAVSLWAG